MMMTPSHEQKARPHANRSGMSRRGALGLMAGALGLAACPGLAMAGAGVRDLAARDADRAELERRAREEWALLEQGGAAKGAGYGLRRVVLDPGHGGFDPGAVGQAGLREKDVTLDLALRCATILEQDLPGVRVFLTRSRDHYLPLSARTALANRHSADLFVSLHVNAGRRAEVNGVETYYCSEKASSREAELVAARENREPESTVDKAVSQYLDLEDLLFRFERKHCWRAGARAAQGLHRILSGLTSLEDRGVRSANFFVLRKARMPAILMETGFISNPGEEARLASDRYRQELALSISGAIAALCREGV